jgi:hypothetical protein
MASGIETGIDYDALIESEAAVFFENAARYLKPEDVALLKQAFAVSREAHEGQTRKSPTSPIRWRWPPCSPTGGWMCRAWPRPCCMMCWKTPASPSRR